MQINRKIDGYCIFAEASILEALRKISENKSGAIFVTTSHNRLEGVVTDGDIRRWLVRQEKVDLQLPVKSVTNKECCYAFLTDSRAQISKLFSSKIRIVPVIDEYHHLVGVATEGRAPIKIGHHYIGEQHPVFIIAEIGINHNGSIDLARQLVDEAVKAGADCVKFQLRNMQSLYGSEKHKKSVGQDLGAEYTLDILAKSQLTDQQMLEIFDYCLDVGILPLCTPWDLASLKLLDQWGMQAFKVASADLTNHQLIGEMIRIGKPIVCSTGMSSEREIIETSQLIIGNGTPLVLLHCNSTYPAPFKDVNLNYLSRLKEIGECSVGYSGHERGIAVPIAAVALGAKMIEKHFTLDKSMEGNDHKVSLLPEEFAMMVTQIRQVEESLGEGRSRLASQGERMNREVLAKSLFINCDVAQGSLIEESMVVIKSPGYGIQPNRLKEIIGKRAKRDLHSGDALFFSDIFGRDVTAREYKFDRPWGIPVRFHDYASLYSMSNPDFLEFHPSYKDMDIDYSRFFEDKLNCDFAVHAPDLFSGDFLLNLADPSPSHRARSIQEMQRVIDLANTLKPYFNVCRDIPIITSIGGFTKERHLTKSERAEQYGRLNESLNQLQTQGVEIMPQTLPPFPWYFGGQLYLNLFVDAEETMQWCQDTGYRVALDLSHAKLSCNYYQKSLSEYVKILGPYSGHLHIVDGKGVDGEGIQINEGEIDFVSICKVLNKYAPGVSFIPEIWQGHKNAGEGFWIALDRLEPML